MHLGVFIYVLFIHWVADFLLQSNYLAQHKSENLLCLITHVGQYTGLIFVLAIPLLFIDAAFPTIELTRESIFWWALINGMTHLIIDYSTSKLTTYYWKKERRHAFFCAIGFDQFLHVSILIITIMRFFVYGG